MGNKEKQSRMRKCFMDYTGVIFDVDGTLYYQWPLRLRMLKRMACYYLCHPLRWKEALAVKVFRQVREHWGDPGKREKDHGERQSGKQIKRSERQKESPGDEEDPLDLLQYRETARRLGKSSDWVRECVERWMYRVPLQELPKCRDQRLAALIERLRGNCKAVLIYSDYPAADKLEALGIRPDGIFTALDEGLMCLKPDPKGMAYILEKTGFSPGEVLMVGDRYSRDGLSAASQGVDYLILPCLPFQREKCYLKLMKKDYL